MRSALSKTFQLYKDSYSGHPREIWNLVIVTLINRMGTMVLPFLSVYFTTELCFSFFEAGLLAGAFGVGSFVGTWIGGKLMDRFNARIVILMSLVLGGLFLICIQFTITLAGLFPMIFFASVFGEANRPAMMATVADFVPKKETGRTMAIMRLAINLGFSLAPLVGGFLVAAFSYSWLFWVDGITCILAGVYFYIVSAKWQKRIFPEDEPAPGSPPVLAVSPYRNQEFLVLLAATLLIGIAFIQWFNSVPVFIKTKWLLDERYIGILMAINGLLIALIEMPVVHSIEKAHKTHQFQLIGLFLIGSSFLFFLLPSSLFWAVLAVTSLTVGEIFFLPFNSATALNLSPAARRGEYMALYSMMWSLVNVLAPAIGLTLAEEIGFHWFWIGIMALSGVGILLFIRIFRQAAE